MSVLAGNRCSQVNLATAKSPQASENSPTLELYAWLDGNEAVRFLPVDQVNTPSMIAANRDMVTINGAVLVDLEGQVAADSMGERQYSGIGGHEDFVAVSGFQVSDRALICLPSASEVQGMMLPRIVDRFPPGTAVTTPRHHIDVVVTEFGAAELAGCTVRERAVALAGIAHPDFRDDLLAVAARDFTLVASVEDASAEVGEARYPGGSRGGEVSLGPPRRCCPPGRRRRWRPQG